MFPRRSSLGASVVGKEGSGCPDKVHPQAHPRPRRPGKTAPITSAAIRPLRWCSKAQGRRADLTSIKAASSGAQTSEPAIRKFFAPPDRKANPVSAAIGMFFIACAEKSGTTRMASSAVSASAVPGMTQTHKCNFELVSVDLRQITDRCGRCAAGGAVARWVSQPQPPGRAAQPSRSFVSHWRGGYRRCRRRASGTRKPARIEVARPGRKARRRWPRLHSKPAAFCTHARHKSAAARRNWHYLVSRVVFRAARLACRPGCSLAYLQPRRVRPGQSPGVPFESSRCRAETLSLYRSRIDLFG